MEASFFDSVNWVSRVRICVPGSKGISKEAGGPMAVVEDETTARRAVGEAS